MTIDDDNSIYVGGLPYDATEESVRRIFDLYGAVVAVKIINDHGIGGKCYGFVTYTNPRSAIDAINDMNGRTIGGRVVRVNEVRTRGGRPSFGRDVFRRGNGRILDWDKVRDHGRDHGRDHERDYGHERVKYRDRNRDHSRDEMYDRIHDHDHNKDHYLDKEHESDGDIDDIDEHNDRSNLHEYEKEHDLNLNRGRDADVTSDHGDDEDIDEEKHARKLHSSNLSDHPSEDLWSESSGDYDFEIREQLDLSIQRLEELQKEIPLMEEKLQERQQHVLDLQNKSQKLEDSLTSAKKISSGRQMFLTKLHKCFLQVKDYNQKLKSSEHELQTLVDAAMGEVEVGDDVVFRDVLLSSANA